MSPSKRQKKKVKEALENKDLQKALELASSQHYNKFHKIQNETDWEKLKEEAQAIRQACVKRLPDLIRQFKEEAKKSGAHVYETETPEEALAHIKAIAQKHKAELIVKSKSMVSEEIHLNSYLEKQGFRVVETDLGEWIVQLADEKPSHITAPALHKTKEEVAKLLSSHLKQDIPPDAKEIAKIAREEMRRVFVDADIGISGANLAVSESGSLVIVSNEGNARLVTTLPPVHIAHY